MIIIKHFITSISLFSNLTAAKYQNAENVDFLENDRKFTNPILVPIINLAKRGEKIRVSVIVTDDPSGSSRRNLQTFIDELNTLRAEIGFEYDEIEEITADYTESTAKHLDCFQKIIESIHSGEEVTADITYGDKPTPIALQTALTFAYLYGDNVVIKALTYGEMDHNCKEKDKGFIFDVSALFYMNSLMAEMTSSKPENPLGFIRAILGKGGNDNDAEG